MLISRHTLLASLFAVATALPLCADDTPALSSLIEQGEWDQVKTQLKQQQESSPDNALVKDIVNDFKLYQKHLQQTQTTRNALIAEKEAEYTEHWQKNELESALLALIEASDLVTDRHKLLSEGIPADIQASAIEKAKQALDSQQWVIAGSLYRYLNLLHPKTQPYNQVSETISRHEQALAIYNPELIASQYKEYAKLFQNKKDDNSSINNPDDIEFEQTHWSQRLSGIKRQMLNEVMQMSVENHVRRPQYVQLIQGGIQGIRTTLATQGIDANISELKDKAALEAFLTGLSQIEQDLQKPGRRLNFRSAKRIVDQVEKLNQDTLKLPESILWFELTQGMTSTLDRFTAVIWPDSMPAFMRSIQGDFSGIGVMLSRETKRLEILVPLDGSPAMRAGLHARDIITHVNGKSTATWDIDKAIRHITGPKGTDVTLTIYRPSDDRSFDVEITRDRIEIDSVRGFSHNTDGSWNWWLDKDAGIVYVRLSQFLPDSDRQIDEAIHQARQQQAINGLVLDLRYNPGGLMSTALTICDRFIDQGRILGTVNGKGEVDEEHRAHKGDEYGFFPVAVLINNYSASASEIVSGSLKETKTALIIGENSYGKGSVQQPTPIATSRFSRTPNALYKITTHHYTLPSGHILHRECNSENWGVAPDLELRITNPEQRKLMSAWQEADYGQDVTPDNNREAYSADEILSEGLDLTLEVARLWIEARQQEDK